MVTRNQLAAPVTLLALFVLLAGIPLVALGWLGWRLLEQDRTLESQRLRERLDNAASLVARELDRSLAAWDDLLPAAARGNSVALPPKAVFLVFDSSGILRQQGIRLQYYPEVSSPSEVPVTRFADAEAQEFRDYRTPDGRPFVGRRADSKKTHRSCRQVKPMELWVHECLCLPLDAADKVTRDPLCLFTSIADSRRKEFISCSVP